MIEPVTATIITALVGGATAIGNGFATEAIKDGYKKLKELIGRVYLRAPPFVEAVEADPASKPEQQVLAKQLSPAIDDPDLTAAAAELIKHIQNLENEPRAKAFINFNTLRLAGNFELSDVEVFDRLLDVNEAVIDKDFRITNIRQRDRGREPREPDAGDDKKNCSCAPAFGG